MGDDTMQRADGSSRLGGRLKLLALFLVCAAPMVAAFLAYFVFPPTALSHYGALIAPQRPIPSGLLLDGRFGDPVRAGMRGKWVLLQADGGGCDAACLNKLYALRQQRTMTGAQRERVVRVWLLTDDQTPDPNWQREYGGTLVARADPSVLSRWLPVEPGRSLRDYVYVIDPLGHLMMRFEAQGDPAKIRRDLARLLRASQIG